MLPKYKDIKEKIEGEPRWYDEAGVPRYCDFSPKRVNNFYAEEVMLILISCQNCGQRFKVTISQGTLEIHKFNSLKDQQKRCIHYGDPPRHDDHLGETMNCIDHEILQYWEQDDTGNWHRNEQYEVNLDVSETNI